MFLLKIRYLALKRLLSLYDIAAGRKLLLNFSVLRLGKDVFLALCKLYTAECVNLYPSHICAKQAVFFSFALKGKKAKNCQFNAAW